MVRPDISDSSTKALHLGSRKAVDIWNKRRRRGENLSEKFTNILLREDEEEQAANGSGTNKEEEQQIRPPRLDLYFAADPEQYKNMTKWRRYFTYTKPEDIAADYDMLTYSLNMLRPRASRYKEQQEAEKLRLYKEERMREREREERRKEQEAALKEKLAREHPEYELKQLQDILENEKQYLEQEKQRLLTIEQEMQQSEAREKEQAARASVNWNYPGNSPERQAMFK
jgi:hypothetical protein